MMVRRTLLAIGTLAAVYTGSLGLAFAHGSGGGGAMPPCGWHQGAHTGPNMMSPGMMGPGMMGQGMMGQGMGPGMMGQGSGPGPMGPGMGMGPGMMGQGMSPGIMMQALPQDLTTEQVRHMFEHRLGMMGNPNLKLGDVTEADEDTITAEIVTQDGSLVQRFAVDRHTGMFRPAQ